MKFSEKIEAFISVYEHAEGTVIKPQVVKLIKAMAATGDQFAAMGEKDACGGYAQRTKEDFIEWGKMELEDPEGRDSPIVDLMYMCYIDGYNARRAAV